MSGLNNLSRIATNLEQLSPKAYELVTSATPLNVAKTLRDSSFVSEINAQAGGIDLGGRIFGSLTEMETLKSLFWGNIGGCIGEVSAFALLLGAAYLLYRNIIIFGIGCGLLTVVIRLVGGYPEGVSYSILFMNVMTPLIDMLTVPKAFGKVKK
jgi:Na+-translocating ferredoxin:NAD+ oxidoreductase RnfD subunit